METICTVENAKDNKWKPKNNKLKIKLNGIPTFVFSYYIL
jgi:hypothetical protein